jgi:hypothetical protein
LVITSVAVFMVTLDNLVVTTAVPVIRQDLHAHGESAGRDRPLVLAIGRGSVGRGGS